MVDAIFLKRKVSLMMLLMHLRWGADFDSVVSGKRVTVEYTNLK